MLNELDLNELFEVSGGKNNNPRYIRHKITDKDTLSGLAQEYGTTVAILQKLNMITNPNLIITGKTLLIPNPLYIPVK